MKKLFISIIVSCVLFACKKKEIPERWPQEHYQIFTNQFIKYTPYQGWAGWRLEKGGNKKVAIRMLLFMCLKGLIQDNVQIVGRR
jgi:hypothetical protein